MLWEEWGGRGVCRECRGRSGVEEGRVVSAVGGVSWERGVL